MLTMGGARRIGGCVMTTDNLPAIRACRPAWNKGRIVGQKRAECRHAEAESRAGEDRAARDRGRTGKRFRHRGRA